MKYTCSILLSFALVFYCTLTLAQNLGVKPIDINIVPGFGTSGLDPDLRSNYVAINIFSGYSDQTLLFQLSTISGTNRTYSGGFHIAGFGNFTGLNVKSIDPEGFEKNVIPYIHLHGFQVAGIMNFVRGDVAGGQLAGLFNISQKEIVGTQIGGLFNFTGRYASGVQIGGISNVVKNATFGLQMALVYNRTGDELFGSQLALINSTKNIEGKNSLLESTRTGLQIGLLNMAKKMNGFQLGIINIAGKMQGTQVGLINIGSPVYQSGAKQGTFIGLLNMGNVLNINAYSSELFLLNTTLYTGVIKNGQLQETTNKYILNGLSWSKYSPNPSFQDHWSLGYEINRLIFNRSIVPGMNERRFFGYHFHYFHIFPTKKIDWELNEILQFGMDAGIKFHPKVGIYGFVGVNLNTHIINSASIEKTQKFIPIGIEAERGLNRYTIGPGLNIGLLIH